MLSRRVIFWISVSITLIAYLLLLWLAPQIILLESDRLAERITTRFQVEFVDALSEPVKAAHAASGETTVQREIETLFSSDPGTLEVKNSMLAEPVETPQLAERLASESIERAYDLEQDEERSKIMDTRILEIAAEDDGARSTPRQLSLPVQRTPCHGRYHGTQPRYSTGEHCSEPARVGVGLLAQAMPMPDDAPQDGTEPPPSRKGSLAANRRGKQPLRHLNGLLWKSPLKGSGERWESEYVHG